MLYSLTLQSLFLMICLLLFTDETFPTRGAFFLLRVWCQRPYKRGHRLLFVVRPACANVISIIIHFLDFDGNRCGGRALHVV